MTDQPQPAQKDTEAVAGKSKGERIFDGITYGGVAGAGVFMASIPFGYWAQYNPTGQKMIGGIASQLAKVGMSVKSTEQAAMTTALMQGGNVSIIPIKMLENHKPEIVNALNKALGDKTEVNFEDAPKQSWGSLIKARLVAWGAVFAGIKGTYMVVGPEKFANFENHFGHKICQMLGKPTHIAGQETRAFRMGKIAALDSLATTSAAAILYVSSRVFAKEDFDVTHNAKALLLEKITDEVVPKPEEQKFADDCESCKLKEMAKKPRAQRFTDAVTSRTPSETQLSV
jgi:hypothetical protein